MLSWATLKAIRGGALRCAMPTIAIAVARSSAATGNPQNSMAATLMVRDTAGDSGPDLPGVTIGFLIASSRAAGSTGGVPVREALPGSVSGILHLTKPYAYYLLLDALS